MTITTDERHQLTLAHALEQEWRRMVKTHVCADCGSLLAMPNDQATGHPYLVCATDHTHHGFRRAGSLHERWKQGQPVPPYVARHFVRQKGAAPMDTKALVAMTDQQMLARVEQAKFPKDLTLPEKRLLTRVAIDYGLDPAMGELMIYQGHPYVSIDGRRRKAQETGKMDGVSTRPATQEERQAWGIPDGDYLFFAEVWVRGARRPFVGYGRVRQAETRAPNRPGAAGYRPLETDPQGMASKRAEARALRMAFSLPLPSAETAGTPEDDNPYIDAEARELPDGEPRSDVDHETGELHPPTSAADVTRSNESPDDGPQLPPPDLPMTTLADLFTACQTYFGIKNWVDIFKLLNIHDKTEIADVGDAWATVCAHRLPPEANE